MLETNQVKLVILEHTDSVLLEGTQRVMGQVEVEVLEVLEKLVRQLVLEMEMEE